MADLRDVYESLDEVPEDFRGLYSERNGKAELTGIRGVKTTADVERVQEALRKEREAHAAATKRLEAWDGLDHAEVLKALDRLPELEAAAKGKLDEAGIEDAVKRRLDAAVATKLSPIEREQKRLQKENEQLAKLNQDLTQERTRRTIHDAVRDQAIQAGMAPEFLEDALLHADRVFEVAPDGAVVTRDKVGVAPGMAPDAWLAEMLDKRPGWRIPSQGAGATGSGPRGAASSGSNPWSASGWNVTRQGAYVKTHGMDKATQMARAAGSYVGATAPAKGK